MKYYIKVGNMFLYDYDVDPNCINNEFISSITLRSDVKDLFISEEFANIVANKIFIITGAKCEVCKNNE